MKNQTVGIAGVGLMGLGIATNIAKAGYRLVFLEHPGNQSTNSLIEMGASSVKDGVSLGKQCDIIILCVTGAPQVEDVLTRDNGVLAGLRSGTMVIDCSTSIPAETKRLAQMVIDRGARFIDAPMTRTPKEAMEGRLNLIVGGAEGDFTEALPLLKCFAENIAHVGDIGAGHTMKLLHNYVSLGFMAVLAEAAASAEKAGIAPDVFTEVLAKGGGGSVVLERLKPFIQDGDPSGLMFSIANAHKDVGYYCKMADDLKTDHTTASGVLAQFAAHVEKGDGNEMLPMLIKLLQK